MTIEELKKEAEKWLCNNLHSASEEDFIKAMLDFAEPREKRIAELEKENAELENKLNIANTNGENFIRQIADLAKENAELKKQFEMSNKVYNDNLDYSHHIEGKLTKAIEILKKYHIECPSKYSFEDIDDMAEQFLSEVEK